MEQADPRMDGTDSAPTSPETGAPESNGHAVAQVGQREVMVPDMPQARQRHPADKLLDSGPVESDDWGFRVNFAPEEPKLFTMMAAEDQMIKGDKGVNWQGLVRTYSIMKTAVGGVPRRQYSDTVVGHQEARRPSLLGGLVDRAQNVVGGGKGKDMGNGMGNGAG